MSKAKSSSSSSATQTSLLGKARNLLTESGAKETGLSTTAQQNVKPDYEALAYSTTEAIAKSMQATKEKVASKVMTKGALWPGINKMYEGYMSNIPTSNEEEVLKKLLKTTKTTMMTSEREKITEELIESTITKMALLERLKNAGGLT